MIFCLKHNIWGLRVRTTQSVQQLNRTVQHFMQDAPICDICGASTVRNGACYKCLNCGNSIGCS